MKWSEGYNSCVYILSSLKSLSEDGKNTGVFANHHRLEGGKNPHSSP